jgi:nitroreductase
MFSKLAEQRYSCRQYSAKPVVRQDIEKLINAARLAPSACNKQPWHFAAVFNENLRYKLGTDGLLPGIKMPWVKTAPVIIVIGIKASNFFYKISTKISKINYPWIDAGIAGEHLVLEATELGLGTCWIGWVKQKEIRKILNWPVSLCPAAMLTIGWPENNEDRLQKKRLDLSEIVEWF